MSHSPNVFLRQALTALLTENPVAAMTRKSVFATLAAGFSHVRETRNVAYGPLPQQRMDLYFPAGRPPLAALVFVHGGSWRTGSKDDYRFVGKALAERGYAVAVVGYRLYPTVQFPGFVQDVAQALVHLNENNARLGWPAAPLWLCGHSAGAHIVMLAAMEPAFCAAFSPVAPPVAGVIGVSGAYSFRPEKDESLMQVFGPREHRQWLMPMCPIDCVGAHQPPLLLMHGSKDTMVSIRVAQRMHERAHAAGQRVRFECLDGQGHHQPVLAFHPAIPGHRHLMHLIDQFCLGLPA